MKYCWKNLILGLFFVLTATLFVACGPKVSASTEIETPTEPTLHQTEDANQLPTIDVPDEQATEDSATSTETDVSQDLHEHSFGEWEPVRASTCVEHGMETRRCACGAHEERELPLSEHEYYQRIVVEKVEPTCTQNGYTIYRCDHCDATRREEDAEATGKHQYDEHTHQCTCGAQQPPLENLQNSYWYDSSQNCRILFETFEPDGENQFKGQYTSSKLRDGKFVQTEKYSGEYTVYINTTIVIHLNNQKSEYNLVYGNNLTYSEIADGEVIKYQLSGTLFSEGKNYTLIFDGYEVH